MLKPIFSFIVVILSVGFAFFYVKPGYDHMVERRADLATLAGIFKDTDRIRALIDQTEKTLQGIDTTDLARFAVFLPEAADPLRLANNLQRIGLVNGIVLGNIKVEEIEKGGQKNDAQKGGSQSALSGAASGAVKIFSLADGNETGQVKETRGRGGMTTATGDKKYATTKASFTFTSTYEAFSKFFFDIENSLGLIDVTSLSFTPVPESTDAKNIKKPAPLLYQYTVEINTYSLK